jgi:hypothetical protein
LHHAVTRFGNNHVLAYLLEKCPASVRTRTRDEDTGALPLLHLYLSHKSHGQMREGIRILVDAYPGALLEPSEDGSLPLHLAVAWTVRFLVRRYEPGRARRPRPGRPAPDPHSAAAAGAGGPFDRDVVRSLASTACPESIRARMPGGVTLAVPEDAPAAHVGGAVRASTRCPVPRRRRPARRR